MLVPLKFAMSRFDVFGFIIYIYIHIVYMCLYVICK